MKDTLRQISVIVSVLATLIVNFLANALPINGQTTGQVSDRFNVYFVPAGYVFSIWGLIYIGVIAYTIFQALPAQRANPRLRATGWWVVLGGVANSVWIFLWHYNLFPLTLIAMLVLLATLIMTYLRLGIRRTAVSSGERWAVQLPFSIYLGWITVATVANATSLLDYLKWGGFGLAPELWMGIVLAAVLVIAVLSGAGDCGVNELYPARRRLRSRDPLGAGRNFGQTRRGGSGGRAYLDHVWFGSADPGSGIIYPKTRSNPNAQPVGDSPEVPLQKGLHVRRMTKANT